MTVRKLFSSSSKLDQPRLFISICLEVMFFLGKILDGGGCIWQILTLLFWLALASRGNLRSLKKRWPMERVFQVPSDGVYRDSGGESRHCTGLKPGVPIHLPIPGWLGLRPGWLGLRPGWLIFGPAKKGAMDERKDGLTDGRTENPPILLDFVLYDNTCIFVDIECDNPEYYTDNQSRLCWVKL